MTFLIKSKAKMLQGVGRNKVNDIVNAVRQIEQSWIIILNLL